MTVQFGDAMRELAEPWLKESHGPAMATAALAPDGSIESYCSGSLSRSDDTAVDTQTIFGIASVTKSFVCAATMAQQDKGLLHIDEPVVKYLPEFTMPGGDHLKKVTIRHLMSHTTGMPPLAGSRHAMRRSHELDDPVSLGDSFEPVTGAYLDTHDDLIAFLSAAEYTLLGEPGNEFSYSNDSYGLLGAILERVTGTTLAECIDGAILQPLGMHRTGFDIDALSRGGNVVTPAVTDGKDDDSVIVDSPLWWRSPAMPGAGSLWSCVDDLMAYARMYLADGDGIGCRVLSPKSVRTMLTANIRIRNNSYYGCGLSLVPDFHGSVLVEHGGALKSITSRLQFVPDRGVATATLVNLRGGPARRIGLAGLNLADGWPVDRSHVLPAPEGLRLPTEFLADYVGSYRSDENVWVNVDIRDGDLTLIVRGGDPKGLLPTAVRDEFVTPDPPGDSGVRFLRDDDGTVCRIFVGLRQVPRVSTNCLSFD